ncbi:hypothetical protein BKA67DRAFT_652984 [Truncatella angustata]|uniref:Uncharacterized protein n=1 Tax=Truncatella angustata TaxID=152316 RepID=A0A9P8UX30_9PEZI|nr:uncharacterized protein BKA67DRAFT_652984 [Truncatella angustata]KAH6659768.1 hypothetical protein BKA67DRAFT_652984 [Truncatella angustata]KAH8203106.1 hypothetical protein TruAng_002739 [Truncatella angustata]
MGGFDQPYLYDADRRDSFAPTKGFDPKAITRASWEPKPRPTKREGPLVSFNRHPDLHEVPTGRTTSFRPMSYRTKGWIVWLRWVQMTLRCLEVIGALGVLALWILISNVEDLTAWIMRIACGVVGINCIYGILHHMRPAGSRTPASSAAYNLFAAFTDTATLPFYTYGAYSARTHSEAWTTLLSDQSLTPRYFVPAAYYTLIGAGGLHLLSLSISLWLGLMFRRIANMPPDMNPLEDHLTARVHKRNKSSVSTSYTAMTEEAKRLSTPLEGRRRSGAPYEDLQRPPSIPFMHTRSGSRDSAISISSKHDLPSRQYGIQPGNSPRNSITSPADLKRLSKPTSGHGSYTELPLHEAGASRPGSRPGSILVDPNPSSNRPPKFTEAWYTSESLITRTQERQRAMNAAARMSASNSRAYEALVQPYDEVSDDDSDRENNMRPDPTDVSDLTDSVIGSNMHPNPLRSNPTPTGSAISAASPPAVPRHGLDDGKSAPRVKTSFYNTRSSVALGEISTNSRSVSGSQDITEQKPAALRPGKAMARVRDSSIQPEGDFFSKPYGQLRASTPPVIVGGKRQVSTGNDFDLGSGDGKKGYRRNVSGKIAEEGRAGTDRRTSRYAVLNRD